MRVVRTRYSSLLLLVLAVLAAQSAAAAGAAVKTGATRYVRVVRLGGGKLTVVLTSRGRRRFRQSLRGDRVLYASCAHLRATPEGVTIGKVTNPAPTSIAAGARSAYRPLLDRRADFCNLDLAQMTLTGRRERIVLVERAPLDAVSLTRRGAEFLEDDQIAARSWTVMLAARADQTFEPGGRFPSAGLLVSSLRRVGGYGRLAVLRAPDLSAPVGTTGIYSDADHHLEIVTVSSGRTRLFIDQNAAVYTTNMEEHIDRFLHAELPYPPA